MYAQFKGHIKVSRNTFKVLLKVLQIPFKVLLKVLRKPLKVLLQLFGNTFKVLRNTFKVLLYTCDLVTLHFFGPKLSRINSLSALFSFYWYNLIHSPTLRSFRHQTFRHIFRQWE